MIKKITEISGDCFEAIVALYNDIGWTAYTEDLTSLKKALVNSSYLYAKFDDNTQELKGLIRGQTDLSSINYIQDILVFTRFQHQGVGSALLRFVLEEYKDVRCQLLLTDDEPKQLAFYKKLGFSNTKQLKKTPLNCFVQYKDFKLS